MQWRARPRSPIDTHSSTGAFFAFFAFCARVRVLAQFMT
jgi:hypothetical protein